MPKSSVSVSVDGAEVGSINIPDINTAVLETKDINVAIKVSNQETSEAATKVLTTAELIESILLHLDMCTLLLAQRVDRYWKDTIVGSSKLQKKLFFTPVKDLNEVIKLHMLDELEGSEPGPPRRGCYITTIGGSYTLINPLIRHKVPSGCLTHPYFSPLRLELESGELRADASWRRMFLTQPHCDCDITEFSFITGHDGEFQIAYGGGFEGIDYPPCTIGELMDRVDMSLNECLHGVVGNYHKALQEDDEYDEEREVLRAAYRGLELELYTPTTTVSALWEEIGKSSKKHE